MCLIHTYENDIGMKMTKLMLLNIIFVWTFVLYKITTVKCFAKQLFMFIKHLPSIIINTIWRIGKSEKFNKNAPKASEYGSRFPVTVNIGQPEAYLIVGKYENCSQMLSSPSKLVTLPAGGEQGYQRFFYRKNRLIQWFSNFF